MAPRQLIDGGQLLSDGIKIAWRAIPPKLKEREMGLRTSRSKEDYDSLYPFGGLVNQ